MYDVQYIRYVGCYCGAMRCGGAARSVQALITRKTWLFFFCMRRGGGVKRTQLMCAFNDLWNVMKSNGRIAYGTRNLSQY